MTVGGLSDDSYRLVWITIDLKRETQRPGSHEPGRFFLKVAFRGAKGDEKATARNFRGAKGDTVTATTVRLLRRMATGRLLRVRR